MDFVHLHIHSEYSLLDGSIKIKKLVKELAKRQACAAALTDHDALHGALEFYLACQAEKINGIIGYEINMEPLFLQDKKKTFHLILIAENTTGYANLLKLCTIANTTGKDRHFPNATSVSWQELKEHASGLICLTSCMLGEFFQLACDPKTENQALDFLKNTMDIFGQNQVFVELIDNGIAQQKQMIAKQVELAEKANVAIVATADTHYLNKKDKQTHLSLLAIKHKLQRDDVKNMPDHVHFHLATAEEMKEKFASYPQAITNTVEIAKRCQLKIDTKSIFMPDYRQHEEESSDECLIRLSKAGLQARKSTVAHWMGSDFNEQAWQAYEQRLEYELSVIVSMKFAGYFLIVQDFINWAKENAIPVGPGRGSAAGSLVTYALRITNIDPIRFNLLFERFLNPERISMPDIDTDFCQDRREEVLQYVYKKYGHRAVSQIVTFGRMMARNAIKNLARINRWAFHESNEFAKLIPESPGITLEQALEQEEKLRQRIEHDERARELWEGAIEIEGTLSSLGIHAAGVIISDRALDERCPLLETEGQLLTQFEHKYAEKVGLIKFDFLGLKTLTVIDHAIKWIVKRHQISIDMESIDLEDPKVYEMISQANVTGLFQLESMGMRKLISELRPTCFSDIVAILALFRPGPLGSGMVEDFVKRKHGLVPVEYPFEQLEPILNDTYGVIVYQEQVQKIAAVLANYSLGEADLLRRAMGKKDKNEMERQKNRFVSGAKENGLQEEPTGELFDLMAKFAEYGFNKSHSAAYGWVTYQTAWLKTYYPTEFMTAILSCDLDNTDKVVTYIHDCKRMKMKILPPCVNHSCFEFTIPSDQTIRFGLGAIKGLGSGIIQTIVEERQRHGLYQSIPEFIARVDARKLNKKFMESLIKAGAFDALNQNRAEIFANADSWLKTIAKETEQQESGGSLFDNPTNRLHSVQVKQVKPWPQHTKLANEFSILGLYLSGHPADAMQSDFKQMSMIPLSDVFMHIDPENIPDFRRKNIFVAGIITMLSEKRNKEGQPYLVFQIEDGSGDLELTLFHRQYAALEFPLKINDAVVVECKVKQGIGKGNARGVVQTIQPLSRKRAEMVKRICLKTQEEFLKNKENMAVLQRILDSHPGHTPVYVSVDFQQEEMNLVAKLGNHAIQPSDAFLSAVEEAWPGLVSVEREYSVVTKFS